MGYHADKCVAAMYSADMDKSISDRAVASRKTHIKNKQAKNDNNESFLNRDEQLIYEAFTSYPRSDNHNSSQ